MMKRIEQVWKMLIKIQYDDEMDTHINVTRRRQHVREKKILQPGQIDVSIVGLRGHKCNCG